MNFQPIILSNPENKNYLFSNKVWDISFMKINIKIKKLTIKWVVYLRKYYKIMKAKVLLQK